MGNEKTLWAWLHLSDIHFGHGSKPYQADQEDLISYIDSDVTEVLDHGEVPAPRAILLTGDVGTTGGMKLGGDGKKEYDAAAEFIDKLKKSLPETPLVFVVPGNHDVERTPLSEQNASDLLKALRDPSSGTSLDDAISDPGKAKILRDRFANYTEFCERIGSPVGAGVDGMWIRRESIEGALSVHLVGLNTAFLCNDDFDHGVLNLPHRTSAEAFESIQRGDLVFVLTHHPTDWLNPRDVIHLTQKIRRHRGVHLHGHIHAPEIKQINYGTGESVVTVAAGAVHADEFESKTGTPHTYSFGALVKLEDGSVVIRIWPRRWVAAKGGWGLDYEQLPFPSHYVQYVLIRPTAIVARDGTRFLLDQAKDLLEALTRWNKGGSSDLVVPIHPSPLLDAEPKQTPPDFELVEKYREDFTNLSNELASLVDGEEDPDPHDGHLADVTSQLRSLLEGAYQQRLTFDGEKRDATGSVVTAEKVFGELSGMPTAVQIHVGPEAMADVDQKIDKIILDGSTTGSDDYIG